jgi:hypothetical protein
MSFRLPSTLLSAHASASPPEPAPNSILDGADPVRVAFLSFGLSSPAALILISPKPVDGHAISNFIWVGEFSFTPLTPSVVITTPANSATCQQGQLVHAGYSCAAAQGANLTTCSAPVAGGAPIDTSTLGTHTFSVPATNNLGASRHLFGSIRRGMSAGDVIGPMRRQNVDG